MANTVASIASGAGDLLTGNWGGALASFSSLFNGHGIYYKADQAAAAGNWPAVATFYKQLYTDPKANDSYGAGFGGYLNGPFSSGANGKFQGKRVTLLPTIYHNTQDAAILQLYNMAVAQGIIPPDNTISAPPVSVIQASGVQSGLNAATLSPGTGVPPMPATATTYTTYIIAAVLVVAIVGLIVWLLKKK